jgi:hypothetical protein
VKKLKVTTFNIRCFGFGGDYFQREKSELRGPYLKHFLDLNYSDTDVFIFQEIMNPLYLPQILPKGFKTYTYTHDYKRHMFIVIACRDDFDVQDLKTIPNTALDKETSRPALYGCLTFKGSQLLDIIGVHLKSQPENTDLRIEQAKAILKFVKKLSSTRPRLIAGDFNSHIIEKTFNNKDDLTYLKEIFDGFFEYIPHNQRTYLSSAADMNLDHFFVKNLNVLGINVYDLPNYTPEQSFKRFYDEISDHLPVTIEVELE